MRIVGSEEAALLAQISDLHVKLAALEQLIKQRLPVPPQPQRKGAPV